MAADCYCFRARRASRLLTRVYDEALRPLGVQTSQLSVLVVIAMAPEAGAPLAVLADVLVMDRTTLSRNLRPLEKAGLVQLARAPRDGRVRLAQLTGAGQQVVEQGYPLWQQAQQKVAAALGTGPAAELRSRLDAVVGAVSGGRTPPPPRS